MKNLLYREPADNARSLGPLAQNEKLMGDIWSEEISVLEREIPEIRNLA